MKKQKIAIVTGASKGIGKAIALKLDREGFKVVLVSRNQNNLKKVLKDFSKNAIIIKTDIAKEKEVISLFQKVINRFKKIDVLVNNAGLILAKDFEKITQSDFDKIIGTNFKGTFFCLRECVKKAKKQNSVCQIININSLAAKTPVLVPQRSIYSASKAAASALSGNLQSEFRHNQKIKIATLYPGLVYDEKNKIKFKKINQPLLRSEDIAETIWMIINQSKTSNISEVVFKPFFRQSFKK